MAIATWETVSEAAVAILKRGEKLSNDRVIEELGGGSKETVAPLLRRFRREHDTSAAVPQVPAPVLAEAQGMATRLYELAKADALTQFAEERAMHAGLMLGVSDDLDRSEAEVTTLGERVTLLTKQLDDALKANTDLSDRLAATEGRLIEENIASETTRRGLEQAEGTIFSLRAELARSQDISKLLHLLESGQVKTTKRTTARKAAPGPGGTDSAVPKKRGRPPKVQAMASAELPSD